MLYYLLQPLARDISVFNLLNYITFRSAAAFVSALLFTFILGPVIIARLRAMAVHQVVRAGNGPTPAATDVVRVHYKGTLLDGTVFDSSYDRGQPAEFGLAQVIPGWSEGVALMPVGSKYTFWIPSELGYGEAGGGPIPANAMLTFEVELMEIVK